MSVIKSDTSALGIIFGSIVLCAGILCFAWIMSSTVHISADISWEGDMKFDMNPNYFGEMGMFKIEQLDTNTFSAHIDADIPVYMLTNIKLGSWNWQGG